jgi:hypothetical protein
LKAECSLKSETIEKFMQVVYTNLTIPPKMDDFRIACNFAIVLLKHPGVKSRFDPREPRYFEAVANYLKKRFQFQYVEVDAIAREFFIDYCRAFGTKRVVRFLDRDPTMAYLFLRFAIAIDIVGDITDVFTKVLQKSSDRMDVFDTLARFLPGGDLPEWAKELQRVITDNDWAQLLRYQGLHSHV